MTAVGVPIQTPATIFYDEYPTSSLGIFSLEFFTTVINKTANCVSAASVV